MKSYGVKIESSLTKFSQKLFFQKVSLMTTASTVLALSSSNELMRVASSNLSFDGLINTNVDTNKFVVLGSDGYLAYRTGTEIQDDLDVTPGTDVVNLVTMISDSGDGARSGQTGQPVFKILGGTDIGVTNSGDTFTVAFTNDTGYGVGDITSVAISEGSNTRTVSSGDATINFVQGEGIDVASATLNSSTVQLTISGEDASDSNKGIVELATTAEADTGTDTARAVTPAGLKSHVDARVIPWVVITGQFNPGSSTAYFAPNNQGVLNTGYTNTDAKFDDSDERIPFFKQNGFIVPCACTLVNIRGYIRKPVVGAKTYKFKILKIAAGDILYESNGNADTTRIFSDLSIAFTDTNSSRYKAVSIDGTESLAQGDMLIPMIANTNGDYSSNTHFQFTLSIKT